MVLKFSQIKLQRGPVSGGVNGDQVSDLVAWLAGQLLDPACVAGIIAPVPQQQPVGPNVPPLSTGGTAPTGGADRP